MKKSTASIVIKLLPILLLATVLHGCSKTSVSGNTPNPPTAVAQVLNCDSIPAELTDRGDGVDYIIKCNVQLSGSSRKLTIDPGVTIQFDGVGSGISVSGGAALKMVGTATKPIVLEGTTDAPGAWTGIQIGNTQNIDNQWEYVTLKNAGAGTYAAGLFMADNAYFLNNTQISIKNCILTNNKGYGIWDYDNGYGYARTVFVDFKNNTFSKNTNAPLNITIDGIGKLDTLSTYTGNGQNYIEIHGFGLYNNTLVQNLNVPYLVGGSIGIHQRLNISPGVIFQFNTDAGFNLDAQYRGAGTFIANGTAAKPIQFVGYTPGKAVWLGLSLGNNDPEILLNYCVVDGAGSNIPNSGTACVGDTKGAINFYPSCSTATAKPVATNCTVSNSGGYGIIYAKGAAISFSGNKYTSNSLDNEHAF